MSLKLQIPDDFLDFLEDNSNILSLTYSFSGKEYILNISDLLKFNDKYISEEDSLKYPPYWIASYDSVVEDIKEITESLKDGEYLYLKTSHSSLYIYPILFDNGGFIFFHKKGDVSYVKTKEEIFKYIVSSCENTRIIKYEKREYTEDSDLLETVYAYASFSDSIYDSEGFKPEGYLSYEEANSRSSVSKKVYKQIGPSRWRFKGEKNV